MDSGLSYGYIHFELLMLEILAVGSFSTGHGDDVLGLMEVGRTWNCL